MEKFETGISGVDNITRGGFPKSRITLVAGGPGCGKTLFMLASLVGGFASRGTPVVFMSFEERPEDIIVNAKAMNLDLQSLIDNKMLRIEYIAAPDETTSESGAYTLDGLILRIELALKSINAEAIGIDTIETLFSMFENQRTVRRELVRVFNWLKDHKVTAMISGEQGAGQLTRHGLEEYVSDCVVFLSQTTLEDVTTRKMRVVKYRGADHGNNEFPFLIDRLGISVMPMSMIPLDHKVMKENVSSGVENLDTSLSGGYRRGSSVLVSGAAGTGKSMLGIAFLAAACERGEKALLLSFEESPDEILFNVKSAGFDLRDAHDSGQLTITSTRPALTGLEQHLVEVHRLVERLEPDVVVVDPLSSLAVAGSPWEVQRTTVRMVDHLKRAGITSLFCMEEMDDEVRTDGLAISSIIDTWLTLQRRRIDGRFERRLAIVKKRGSAHAEGYLDYRISSNGITFESNGND